MRNRTSHSLQARIQFIFTHNISPEMSIGKLKQDVKMKIENGIPASSQNQAQVRLNSEQREWKWQSIIMTTAENLILDN